MGLAALAAIAFFAFNSIKAEYARIQSRVEVTQAKVDALADELAATSKTVHDAIKRFTVRFMQIEGELKPMTKEEAEAFNDLQNVEKVPVKGDSVNSLLERTSSVPTIIMHTTPSCGPCKKWVENDSERWRNSGWEVVVLPPEEDPSKRYPWYEIIDRDGKRFEVNGPLNNSNFNAARAGAK